MICQKENTFTHKENGNTLKVSCALPVGGASAGKVGRATVVLPTHSRSQPLYQEVLP